jgi:hypothetical protein
VQAESPKNINRKQTTKRTNSIERQERYGTIGRSGDCKERLQIADWKRFPGMMVYMYNIAKLQSH